MPATMAANLIVRAPDGKERTVALLKRITSVGRDPENDVAIDDPDLAATALHIGFDGHEFTAACHDGGAMTVNGKSRVTCQLGPGDRIRLASSELVFSPTPSREPELSLTREGVHLPVASLADRVEAMRALMRFSERLLAATDLDRLLEELVDAVIEVTHADKGFLLLLESGEMSIRAARRLTRTSVEDAVARVSDSIIQKVVQTRRPVVVADAFHDKEWSSSSSVVNLKLCSVMCAPLMEKGEVLGVIYVGNDNVVSLFDDKDLEALTIFAAQASLLVQNAMLLDDLKRENASLKQAIAVRQYGDLIGTGASMAEVFRRIDKVAGTLVSILITGETGTGKELVAREIHRRSPRAAGPFIAVNCGAIPENLLESELFGHAKGAFTGAILARQGRFQAANGGTLFLDEIGDMPLALQVKILRVLQEHTVIRVGDNRAEPLDIRVIAATNRVLEQEIKNGAFREDLYYRLNVISIDLPPLRERGDDVLDIARYFLQKCASEFGSRARGFAPSAAVAMRKYAWPGNIRELENRVKKAVVLADRALLRAEDLDLAAEDFEPIVPLAQAKEDFQKRYIADVLLRNSGNRTKTAKDLGVDPRTIFRHLEKMEAERRGEAPSPYTEEGEPS
jgi:transcriptional regulator with GAF, ATPase, and Fis domain